MAKTGNQAIAWAREHLRWAVGYCQMYVRTAFGLGGGFGSASAQWYGADRKHATENTHSIPRGVPVLWTGGSHGYGHIAICTGNGNCWSTDAGGAGVVAKVPISSLTSRWSLDFRGWIEDVNGVDIYSGRPSRPPLIKRLKFAVDLDRVKPGNHNWHIRRVQRALRKHGYRDQKVTGYFGNMTRDNVRHFQRKHGWRGKDANGIPGKFTAKLLGLKPR